MSTPWGRWQETSALVGELDKREDPVEEPYKSKYAARAALESLGKSLSDDLSAAAPLEAASSAETKDVLAVVYCHLGMNYVTTEENQAGEEPLLHCVKWLHPRLTQAALADGEGEGGASPTSRYALATLGLACIDACNYLSLLFSGWDRHSRALRYLRIAKEVYGAVTAALPGAAGSDPRAGLDESVLATQLPALLKRLDSAFTHTCFYYAQVYGRLGVGAAASRYIYTTLLRQLHEQQQAAAEAQATGGEAAASLAASAFAADSLLPSGSPSSSVASLDRVEWIRNALRLSDFHVSRQAWRAAAHCIAAADAVLAEEVAKAKAAAAAAITVSNAAEAAAGGVLEAEVDAAGASMVPSVAPPPAATPALPDRLARLLAEVPAHWGRLYVAVLRVGRDACAAAQSNRGTLPADVVEEVDGESEAGWAAALAELQAQLDAAGDKKGKRTREERGGLEMATGTSSGGGSSASSSSSSTNQELEDAEDPFSTAPRVPRPAAALVLPRSKKDKLMVGEGPDAVDAADSDHEGDVDMRAWTGCAAADATGGRHAAPPAARSANADLAGALPFAASLLACQGNGASPDYEAYGPADLTSRSPSAAVAPLTRAPVAYGCAGRVVSGLAALPLPSTVRTFEDAREVFKAALLSLTQALKYFVLDGFVTDHVALQQDLARAYKYLAWWERDLKRKQAMHTRRADPLAPLLELLNPTVYLHTHKEASLEVAAACQDAFDARLKRAEETGETAQGSPAWPAARDALLKLADRCIAAYAHFIRCYAEPRLGPDVPVDARNTPLPPLQGASDLDHPSANAYLTAHFFIALMLHRRPSPTPAARAADLQASLARFTWLLRAIPAVRPPGEDPATFFAQETAMAREMVALLPRRLQLLMTRGN